MSENIKGKEAKEGNYIDLIELFKKIWAGRRFIIKWVGI